MRFRIAVSLFSTLVVIYIAVMIFAAPVLFRVFTRSTYEDLNVIASDIKSLASNSGGYYFSVYSLAVNNGVTIEIVNSDDIIIYTTANAASALDAGSFSSSGSTHSVYSQMRDTDSAYYTGGRENFEVKTRSGTSADYFIFHYTDDAGHTFYIYSPVANVEKIVNITAKVFALFILTVIAGLAIVLTAFLRTFTTPIVEMNTVTKRMAALDFSGKCKNYGEDEIGQLGQSINTLSNSLDETLEDLKVKNLQLEKDIELRLALDNARKSFISNVSHELKTPIAIISGFAEGLCEGIVTDRETILEYCRIINDESIKMNSLVVELLELSKLESKMDSFLPEYFDPGAKVNVLLEHLSLSIEKNEITIINNIPSGITCFAQSDKIEIVFKNYITNAISHADGDKINKLDCEDMGDKYRFTVFNTGKNIANEDFDEIWDSFYRADKAHGRKENRYGLGLSIVKSIMLNHKCGYGVENLDNGVRFYFEVFKGSEFYEKESK
ncbi:MAG: HAMP domain-containing histidine kinase [Clostridiales bacterium]|nr:HAMP domain-containing histidine kinase [Clostridiales bacterium]